jgi:S1-C subfamily serine protease
VRPFESRWERFFPYILGVIFGLSIALLVISIVMFKRAGERSPFGRVSSGAQMSAQIERERSSAIIEATRMVSPTVVSIMALRTELVRPNPLLNYNYFFQRYFLNRPIPEMYRERYSNLGSGLIISQDGYILTNEHVVRDAEQIIVTLTDGSEVSGALVGSSSIYDIALLKIEARNLPYAPLGDSGGLQIGEWVIAIGSPFGYLLNDTQPTVTVGVISALNRDVKSSSESEAIFRNMIQTDAAINPGNSGGPLVSSNGQVIGINTFIFSAEDGTTLGMGFAIPADIAKMVIEEFKQYGKVRSVWTGLEARPLTPDIAASIGLSVSSGLLITRIVDSSPASEAELQIGDIIVEVNGTRIESIQEATRAIYGLRVGDILEMVVIRDGEAKKMGMVLGERPSRI